MIVNFRIHGINRGTRKLTRTPTLMKKKSDQSHAPMGSATMKAHAYIVVILAQFPSSLPPPQDH